MEKYDLIIIGAGPAGLAAANRASELGLRPCLIEKEKPGGICLNYGCIPAKSLIYFARIFKQRSKLIEMGVKVDISGFDYSKVYFKSRNIVENLLKGIDYKLKKNRVPLKTGIARISDNKSVKLETGEIIKGDNIVIATGSKPKTIKGFHFDGNYFMFKEITKDIINNRSRPCRM